jgi:hypothetical protein
MLRPINPKSFQMYMQILMDIEKLMTGSDLALVEGPVL